MSRRPLDETIKRELAAVLAALPDRTHDEFTGLTSLNTFRKLAGGYANLVYEINDHYILRVFFRAGWEVNFENEGLALAMLRAVPGVPQIISSGVLSLEWPCPYLLVNKLTGDNAFTPWLHTSADIRQIWTQGIAAVLRHAHALPVGRYGSLASIDEPSECAPSWQTYHDMKIAELLTAVRSRPMPDATRYLVAQAEAYYASHRRTLEFRTGPRLVHGDVRLHNIIVDGHRMTGVIDWEWAHGGEPEEDMINLVRFTLFPGHEASGVEAEATRAEYAPLLLMLLAAYPELASVPDLPIRLTLYLIEADLGQLCVGSETIRGNAEIRLREWLRGDFIEDWIVARRTV